MHPLKQPELFLDLAARMPKEQFVLVAFRDDMQPALCARIRSRASRLPNVSLKEGVAWSDIGRFFEQAKLFVNTSVYEGFPNTFVQAAHHSVPILSWSVDPDLVLTRHRIGFCGEGVFERLCEAAQELCDNDSLRLEMGDRAAAYARDHHDLGIMTAQFKAMIQSLLPKVVT